ncbi:MAG: hypothetical protein ACRELB_18410, partial [Polyangiaceae bacterium]
MPATPSPTRFALSPSKLAVLEPCIDAQGAGGEDGEWPNNLLSVRTVVDESGAIGRRGQLVERAVDPAELALCARLAREAAEIMRGVSVGMGSESGSGFADFFVAAGAGDEPAAARIDEPLVRRAFGGTIFPPATMAVEPLKEDGVWWSEVLADGEGQDEAYFAPWRALMAWFAGQESLVDSAFVRIGDYRALLALEPGDLPE